MDKQQKLFKAFTKAIDGYYEYTNVFFILCETDLPTDIEAILTAWDYQMSITEVKSMGTEVWDGTRIVDAYIEGPVPIEDLEVLQKHVNVWKLTKIIEEVEL